jgi:hypothetical protein
MFPRTVTEKSKHILRVITFSENRAVYETTLKNKAEPKKPQNGNMAARRMLD